LALILSTICYASKKVIIIGATSGLGRELALRYLVNKDIVGVTGRRENYLQEIKEQFPEQVFTEAFDVTGPHTVTHLKALIQKMNGMDLLIYNAGIGDTSEELNLEIEVNTTKTNVSGFVEMVAFAFTYFAQKGSGQIAIISSLASLRGNSWAPAYSASKAFMSTYAEGLNMKAIRLKKDIVVTDLKPGFLATKPAKGNKRFWVVPVAKAAGQVIAAIEAKKRKAYISKRWWLVAQIMKIIPYSIYSRMA
jgi:short-subunit dehydrogenase